MLKKNRNILALTISVICFSIPVSAQQTIGQRMAFSEKLACNQQPCGKAASISSGPQKGILKKIFFKRRSEPKDQELLTEARTVFLDFDASSGPTFPVSDLATGETLQFINHIYTQAERDEIQRRMEVNYSPFNFVFTQSEPTIEKFYRINFAVTENTPIRINATPGNINVRFGTAENFEFRALTRTGTADVSAALWEYLAQIDPSGERFMGESRIPITTTLKDAVSEAVINQTSRTASHELGHLVGLEHHDSYGAPGNGIPEAIDINDSIPPFTGPQNATETNLHIMATGSTGFRFKNQAAGGTFFSERSALKLALIDRNILTQEIEKSPNTSKVQDISLRTLRVPNTLQAGQNKDSLLLSKVAVVSGSIDSERQDDDYRFHAQASDIVTIEMFSLQLARVNELVLTELALFKQESDGSLTQLDTNIKSAGGGSDPLIIDFILPSTGQYIARVKPRPLDQITLPVLETGNYELLIYSFNPERLAKFKRP